MATETARSPTMLAVVAREIVLRLERFRGGNRRATLEKHQSKPAGDTARFRIVGDGLRGVTDGPHGAEDGPI